VVFFGQGLAVARGDNTQDVHPTLWHGPDVDCWPEL
jgi:hypothetical protein